MDASDSPPRPGLFEPAVLVATCGGIGWIPFAPGTFGSLVGLPLSLGLAAVATPIAAMLGLTGPAGGASVEVALVAVLFAVGIPICTRAARLLGGTDPGPIVLDEVVAVPLVLVAVPPEARGLVVLAAAFVLFRVFDILKPPPCRQLERLPTGLGIMADDQGAAVLAAACLGLARWRGWL